MTKHRFARLVHTYGPRFVLALAVGYTVEASWVVLGGSLGVLTILTAALCQFAALFIYDALLPRKDADDA